MAAAASAKAVEAVVPAEAAAAVIKPAASCQEAAWLPLRELWAAAAGDAVPRVRWWIEDDRLLWEMKTSVPRADREAFKSHGFVEGLWEQDVAEFFIADRRTGHYQEFNLSPGGAWWSACFTAPRLRLDPQPAPITFDLRTEVVWTDSEWIGRLSQPLPDIMRPVNGWHPGPGGSVNFTAIVAGRSGRRFYSLAPLGGAAPDFHRIDDWIPLI